MNFGFDQSKVSTWIQTDSHAEFKSEVYIIISHTKYMLIKYTYS